MKDARAPRPAPPEGEAASVRSAGGLHLPDLCSGTAVLFLSLIGVLLALCFVLFASGLATFDWIGLGRAAAFICWNMLASAAMLCALASWLRKLPLPAGASAALCVILAICLLSSLAERWLLGSLIGGYPFAVDAGSLARNLLVGALLGMAALRYFHLQGELIERERAELDARILALQARIRPHFLFNSLNTIAALADTDSPRAASAVEDLADLFRASLAAERMVATVATELEVAQAYVRLEQERLGSRLQVNWDLTALDTSVPMPPLMLQPLLENAVYHGIERLPEGGCITVAGGSDGQLAWLEVANPLPVHAPAPLHTGHQEALANIRERLSLLYGGRGSLQTTASTTGFTARLCWPFTGNR